MCLEAKLCIAVSQRNFMCNSALIMIGGSSSVMFYSFSVVLNMLQKTNSLSFDKNSQTLYLYHLV